ncbi:MULTISPECIES: universal stress protein [Subtercola]|uniref:Universal stress protein n=1 Tax=Subtercola vilae TaxID=2056433 RepID=A0A4T2CBA7_9MICO|nr:MULTISPECIES: universal stress protein [Subtercola]MEA9983818.1 universal stress protein [Subtercola sp. RTI3]TIH40641.1 universal stress protein [Subtercola vilae]
MSGNIIVGINESAPSRAATSWALDHSGVDNAEVVLTHVMTVTDSHDAHIVSVASARLADHAHTARLAAPHVTVSSELRVGDTLNELIEATSGGAAAIVIGTHKTGFVQGRVYGSRFIQLAAAAHCPVVFVPSSSGRSSHTGVVVGVKGVELDRTALAFAAREAASTGSRLSIVHCWTLPDVADETFTAHTNRSMLQALRADKTLAAAEAIARAVEPALTIRTRSIRRPTAEGLIETSASALLLVLGQSQHEGSAGRVLGHTVHDVLMNLAVPTAIMAVDAPAYATAT